MAAKGTTRLLVKVRRARGQGVALGATNGARLDHLFDVPAGSSRVGLAGGEALGWYLAHLSEDALGHPWDVAHAQLLEGQGLAAGIPGVLHVEPDFLQDWLPQTPTRDFAPLTDAEPSGEAHPQDPKLPEGPDRHWHLEDRFGGLKAARADAAGGAGVVIAHLDTGYDPAHVTCPRGLDRQHQRNFVDSGFPNDATDRAPATGFLRNRGHGTATLGLLAGNVVGPQGAGGALAAGEALGGAPAATVIPIRVANSVVQLYTSAVAQGLTYALQNKADVVSMSLGGLASDSWADAVNAAYDAGIVLVTAAGNNYGGVPTSFIVYPARFGRVLAACGVMANRTAYDGLRLPTMSGNHGPLSKMKTALSAFSPNVSWARLGSNDIIDWDGQGTSAATPQIAAAAALYLAKHKEALSDMKDWRRVEAVRNALFGSASRDARAAADGVSLELGWGALNAEAALAIAPTAADDSKQPPADASFAFLKSLFGLGLAGDPRASMYGLEMTQLAQQSRQLEQLLPDPDLPADDIPEGGRRRFLEAVLADAGASRALKAFLAQRMVRRPGKGLPPGVPPIAGVTALPKRRSTQLVPAARRLRIFAVDPSYGTSLSTAFINETTVDVPWERNATSANVLQPGPVGEYLEVVDIDPASGAAYEPVDLNDPSLLAQDGHPPSEGNPQFHQQMTYAVAMRTIRHFETALGRVALWASRSSPRDEYVQRLRIYPHALLQRNAFYSPEKKALLFGYFAAPASEYSGAESAMVFTCLSHDVIAHETTHALLDGIHPRLREVTNGDVLAFHEAFADVVAIFQHFTMSDVLFHALEESKGDLRRAQALAALAQQFGQTAEHSKQLRSALDVNGPKRVLTTDLTEPHQRGAVLLAAVFDAFLAIYGRRTADLFRLTEGRVGPELIKRLAEEAAKTSHHILNICIRALDYLPPVDVTFDDYLRALITADADLVPMDRLGYRVAFLEAFRARGIVLKDVRTYSVESACWKAPLDQPPKLAEVLSRLDLTWDLSADRKQAWEHQRHNAVLLHEWIVENLAADDGWTLGLDLTRGKDGKPRRPVEVHSVRPARRIAPDGSHATDLVVVITQKREVEEKDLTYNFRGGCTLLISLARGEERVRYAVVKDLNSAPRQQRETRFRTQGGDASMASLYFGKARALEPFAFTHVGH